MATLGDRPFSKNYSGLKNQSVIAGVIIVLFVTASELMKRKRRGKPECHGEGLGSVESWEFGYLYQGRSWAKNPSPPLPQGRPLSWVKQVLLFPEQRLNELRGVDASLYCRFLRGCWWFVLLHCFTTLPILFPIHVIFSPSWVPRKSMTRASITSLVDTAKGLSLLWIHISLLFWITLTWMFTLHWISRGAFQFRAKNIQATADRVASQAEAEKDSQFCAHPHPQFPFLALPTLDHENWSRGLRLRTVMVTNVPPQLRSDKDLKEYFQYYLSRPLTKPSMGLTASIQPGFFNKFSAFLFNRAKRIPVKLPSALSPLTTREVMEPVGEINPGSTLRDPPAIDHVVVARKMTELASLLQRREDVMRRLETAHIKLAKKALMAVKEAIYHKEKNAKAAETILDKMATSIPSADLERGGHGREGSIEGEDRMELLIRTLGPFVHEFDLHHPYGRRRKLSKMDRRPQTGSVVELERPKHSRDDNKTIWDALLSLPRSSLDAYQPLIHLSALFRGKTVPSIDYYTAKLGLLSALITENRARAVNDYDPVSTAFVSFVNPDDARKACKYLTVHPENPLACLVTMAPSYEDLDWTRIMRSTFRAEFVKDWVVDIGVWAFTLFWLIPVSFFVTLVSINSLSAIWPWLSRYLERHEWEGELIESFAPTLLVSLLSITIPLLLLLIAKKAHTIITLSALHDKIMSRYYKFLIVNLLVFFCAGTALLQSFLQNFGQATGDFVNKISNSFPSAGPFYVGWLIFTTAIHASFELALFGLPLIMYPTTKRQIIPRKRAVGIRPRTFNYYYWLPNHLLVIHVLLVFSVLNPLVIPFGFLYFSVERVVIKNQLLHVYAKNYEGNGQLLLVRMIRYSLDGLMFSQGVFLVYMIFLKKRTNIGLAAFLICFTAAVKLAATRFVRAHYEHDDMIEADILCGTGENVGLPESISGSTDGSMDLENHSRALVGTSSSDNRQHSQFWTWKIPRSLDFAYATVPSRPRRRPHRRQPNPFGPDDTDKPPFTRLRSFDIPQKSELYGSLVPERAAMSMPSLDTVTPIYETTTPPIEEDSPSIICGPSTPALVTPHPPHPRWDDESNPDHPYDNPFYTQGVSNVLWLPRDPIGLLNLDDTVDVRKALTTEPGADRLGEWPAEQSGSIVSGVSGISGLALSTINSSADINMDQQSFTSRQQYTGSEQISLRPRLAERVQSIEKEDDVEVALEHPSPPFRRRRTSSDRMSSSTSRGSLGLGRATFGAGMRSFSSSSGQTRPRPRRNPSSILSTADPRTQEYSGSNQNQDPGARPDFHAQGEFAKDALSIVNSSADNIGGFSGAAASGTGVSAISTQTAVMHEVIKEEQEAAEDRLLREHEEAKDSSNTRSWMTSWMFRKT